MNLIRQSFKRQLFAILMITTVILVICGGILTIQGFQARLKADYEKRDIEQSKVINTRLINDLEQAEHAVQELSENEVIINAISRKRNNSLSIYSELYAISKDIRDFAAVDIYQGSKCIFSTATSSLSKELPLNYSVLREAAEKEDSIIFSLDPTYSSENGAQNG